MQEEQAIETLAIVLGAGLVAEFLARVARVPRMIFLLAARRTRSPRSPSSRRWS